MQKMMFNDKYGLTKAVLEGRKTMTRRIVPGRYLGEFPNEVDLSEAIYNGHAFMKGEVVAVAQNYNEVFDEFATIAYLQDKPTPDNFKAFGEQSDVTLPKAMPGWNNKMFVRADLMPHKIRIKNVRVERLQDISDKDCLREGIYKDNPRPGFYFNGYAFELSEDQHGNVLAARWFKTPRDAFAALIDKVSGRGTWASNPWVFVYEFELVK